MESYSVLQNIWIGSIVLDKDEKYYIVIDGLTEFIGASNLDNT